MGNIIFFENGNTKMKSIACLDHPKIVDFMIDGEGKWEFGDFGAAHPEITKATGATNYNVKMISSFETTYGVVNKDGTKITKWHMGNCIENLKLINEDELKNMGDPADEIPNKYFSSQPNNQGKIIWLTGAPGMLGTFLTASYSHRSKE